jgi:hypothetical protein
VWYRNARVLAIIAVLLPLAIVLSVIHFTTADTGMTAGWFGSQPASVVKAFDLSAAPVASNKDCTKASIQIDNNFFGVPSPFEEHCYVSTAMGLIEQQGLYIQPPGYTKASRLVNTAQGGNPVLIPIPNQAGALWLRGFDGGNGTVTLQYFKDLYNHLSYDYFYQRFNISSGPDLTFGYFNHTPAMQFDFSSLAMDPNGRFMIVDTVYNGIVRIDTLSLTMMPIAASLPGGEGANATAVNSSGKIAAISHDGAGEGGGGYFKVVDIGGCASAGSPADNYQITTPNCPTVDLFPKLVQSIPQLVSITNVRFANDRTITFVAKSGASAAGYKYARYSITGGGYALSLVQYEALGDSYISGEGAFNYRAGTNTERNGCHQSLSSYPYLLSGQFNSFADVACSGAEMHNVAPPTVGDEKEYQLNDGIPSQTEVENATAAHIPGVIFQNTFVGQDNPETVTLSVGGNDIGFAGIIQKCINPFQGSTFSVVGHLTCYDTYEDRLELVNTINDQFTRLRDLYESLKSNATGDRRVYVVGYPQVMKVGGDCGVNVAMNANEVAFAHDLIDYLDGVIKRAADEAGVGYVDTQHVFDGHRLCEGAAGQIAVNGLTIAKQPARAPDINGSFHPNVMGHELLAGAVASQTHTMTNPMPVATPRTNQFGVDPTAPILQNIPHSGRTVRRVNPNLSGLGGIVQKNASLKLVATARSFYTKPGATYSFTYGKGLVNLGSFVADALGNITINATLPADTPSGFQTMHIYGNDIFGQPIDLQEVVFVAASDTDYDNDGVPNDTDSCPLAVQGGTDADHDGIDDVCDPQVIIKPVVTIPDDIVWQDNAILRVDIYGTQPQTTASP